MELKNIKKRYHFCTKEFLEELKNKSIIYADDRNPKGSTNFAYNYIFFKEKKINNGNGMFFLWEDYNCKGYKLNISNNHNKEQFVLLELNIPSELCTDTNYDNWCSFIMDLDEADGDYELANEICIEHGVKGGLEGSYQSIYDIEDTSRIQTLVPYINVDWIKNIKYTNFKVI